MASSLWGHRQTEDDEELKRKGLSALTGVAAKDTLDNPDVKPADEIADFDEDMEVETDDAEVELPDDSLPEVELPDDAEDETPKMGVGEHSRMTVRSETGKRADEILHGGDDLFTKTMGLFGVSKEGAASALIHTAPFARQISKIDASREEKALERLRTGEYDDSDMKAIAEEAGLSYDLEDIGRATAGSMDPINEQRRFLAMTAEDELLKRAQTRGEASNEIERRGQTTWGKIASGTLENSGYVASFIYGSSIAGGLGIGMTAAEGAGKLAQIGVGAVNTMIGSAPVSAVGAVERYERLSGKDYQVGENGELQVIDNNYGELRSALQGGIGGFVENTVVEGLTDTAIELGCLGLSKIPGAQAFIVKPLQRLGNAAVRKMMGNKAGRALLQVGKAYNGISQFTHFHSQPVEMLEEDLQPIFDNVFGLDKKRGEYKGFGGEAKEYWDKTLTWANQKDIFYGLVGTCLLQAGVGGAGASWARRTQPGATTAKEATSVLTDYANVPKEKVATLSDDEKIALCDLYRTMSANPDKMVEFAEQIGAKAGTIMEDVVNRAGANMNRRLEAEGMKPTTFQIPMREENGKNVPDFQFTIATDMVTGKTYKGRAVTDAESGVVIMENGSGVGTERAYTVMDPITKQSVDVPNLMLARKAASLFKNTAAMVSADRAAKQQYINNVWQQKYGNANVEQYDTVQQAIAASSRHGVDITAQEGFNPNRPAWHLNDGTIIFVRDNINSPYEVDTLFQHEIIGHNAEAMADEFMGKLDSKSMREAQETLGLADEQMADPRIRREVFANLIQQRRHNPSFMQKFKHFIGEKMGGKKITDADIEVLAQRWEQAAIGEAGNMKSESAGNDMEFLDEDGNAVGVEDADIEIEEEETTDETGTGADEAQAQPVQGAERPAEPEAPQSETGTAVKPEKPVSERSVIEKMTDRAPVQELPVAEVFNDDTRIPNFKEGANPETGEVEPLQGEPYDLVSNPIVVMEFKDGKKVVVTGRHRLALYKRAGREKIAARVIREADGWTVQDAKMIDSIGNIIDEKGSVKDYVKYFEDARPSREAAEAGGFLARSKGKLAFGIYEGATEDTRSAIDWEGGGADGMISVEQAGIIAEAAPRNSNPRNKALQRILVKKALDGLRGKKLGILARSLAEEVKNQKEPASAGGEMQLDLFSSPEDQALLAMEDKRADYRTRKSQEYGRIAEVLRTAMAKGGKLDLNDGYARELGITDPKDRNQLAAARDKAVERANYWENAVRLDEADKTAMDAEIGASAKKTETKKTEVSERLKAIKEKKPKSKAEKPAQKPAEKPPVSAPQQTEVKTPPKSEKPVEGQKSSDAGVANGSVTPQQADAFASWQQYNPNAKVRSVFLRNDGTVSFGYEDGSGVARSAYLYADGERSNATPVHIAWKDFDEIHGKNAVRIDVSDLGTKKADLETKSQKAETKTPKTETKPPKTETPAPKTETPVVRESRTTEEPDPSMVEKIFANTTFQGGNRKARIKAIVDTWRQMRDMVRPGEKVDITDIYNKIGSRDAVDRALSYPDPFTGKMWDGRTEYGDNDFGKFVVTRPQEELQNGAPVRESRTTEKSSQVATPRKKTVVLKDAERAKAAQSQANDLMNLFATPELDARQMTGRLDNEEKFRAWAKKWNLDPAKEKYQREWAKKNGVMFASPEFDPEKFQQRVGAMAKLVSTLNQEGYNDFKSIASYLSENFPKDRFDAAKPYLRSVWNAVADAMGLEEVSKKDAETVYSAIEKSYNEQPKEINNDERMDEHGRSDAGEPSAHDSVHAQEDNRDGQGGNAGQESSGNGEERAAEPVARGGGRDGQAVSVERPAVGDGTVSAGGRSGAAQPEGSQAVGEHTGRGTGNSGGSVEGGKHELDMESGQSGGVEPGGRGSVSGQDGQSVAAPVRAALNEQAPNAVKNENYIITDADERAIEGGKPKDKVRANIAAIRIVRKLAEDGREATPEEKTALARYVGWGGLKPAFNNTYYNAYEREQSEGTLPPQTWAAIRKTPLGEEGYDLYKQMRELLSQEEIKSIEESTTSAFFTPIRLCRSIHRALASAGLTEGRLLETSAGIGNMIGTGEYTNPRWTAVELDKVTGQILKALYPKANVRIQGFEDVIMPDNFMDAAISNVPFGTNHPFDPNYKKYNFLVHDFFFAKAIDKIHPGGVAALITATGTLDKRDKSLIRYLSEHGGKIVGAVRIPNGFFAKNAGTDVATDVVFIQKVNGTADNSVFLETAEYKGCPISRYFLDHPELCMGKKVPGTNQFAQPELSYKAVDDDYSKIDEAIQKAAEGLEYKSVNEMGAPQKVVLDVDVNGLKNGNIGVVDGKIVRREGEEVVEVPKSQIKGVTQPLMKRGVTPQKIVQKICELRDAMQKVIDAQMNDCTDEELARLQKDLNFAYDFIKRNYGALHSRLVNQFVELDWAAAPLLSGLETPIQEPNGVDKNGNQKFKTVGWEKNDIFTKRVIAGRASSPSSAATALDGLRISLNELGTVSTARIAELTGKSEDEVKKELLETGLVFVNPETSGIETRDEYLSGSVRKKLKAARVAAEIDPSFKKNVDALEQVQPDDIAATDISYQLGQNWIPRDIYEQFFKEVIFQNTSPRLTVVFDPREHLWHVDTKGHGQTEYDEESGLAIEDLLERTMNGRSIVVRRRVSENEYVVDQPATTATKIVQEKIARAFQSWMTDDTDRAERIERLYNDIMNDCVPRQYDTDVLEFYGLSKEWADRVGTKGREYQKRCIARGTFGGNLLIAHCVGAGKTFEMASICMQLRRLGIARKPMFAVPNHMLAQWNREFHEAYPGAKVLVADKKDLTKQNRRAFLARAANGDWDCIIVAHSSFSRIAMSPEHQAEYIEEELKDLNDLLFRVQSEKEKKKIRKKIQSLRDKLKSLLDPSKKDDAIKFEELGCDYLFVDEAHNFKGIQINTHMSNVPGVTGSVSQRAQDLEMKCRFIAKMHGGDKGVVFATGTPISNSISEMYVMMRYLAPSKMDEMGVRSFDDWAKQFGQVVNEWSPNPSGVGFREKARFSQFQNVPEMKRFFRSFSDIVLDSELKIKRPYMIGGKPIQHVLKPSAAQVAYVQELNKRMERMQNSKVDPTEDNMLKVTTEGRLLAIDPMLIGVKDESHTRANACADEVKRIYDKSTGKPVIDRDGQQIQINGTQLIFCDSGVPKKKQFKQLVRTADGNYEVASGKFILRVYKPDAFGKRYYEIVRGDNGTVMWRRKVNKGTVENPRMELDGIADHSIEGWEDLGSVYMALEDMQKTVELWKKPDAVGNLIVDTRGWKVAPKPKGTPVDINTWIDLNLDTLGYDPRFSNPYAMQAEDEAENSEEGDGAADDKDMSEEANGDVEVDNMLRGKFNMYAELRKQLIRRGIPADEIAFIHDAETMTQKQALFDRVKRGEIRILIGNTAKMGEGTNVQDRLVAIHHLDIPWKPAWITQRDGRGIRSGNLNDEIGIHTYITEGTFDVYSWDTVGRKAKFIENAMNSRMDQRTIEDVDSTVMSLEEGKAAAAGDPRILERVKLIKEIEKERMAFDTQAKALDRSQMKVRVAERDLLEAEKRTAQEREAIDRYNAAKGDSPFTLMTAEDEPKALTDNTELARYIQDKLGFFARKGSSDGYVGTLFGFGVRYERGEGTDRGAYMTIKELGVKFPVTVLPGTGAAFPPSDLSKFKTAVTTSTNQKYRASLDSYVDSFRKRLEVARKGVENAAGFDSDAASAKIGDMNLHLAHLNRALGIKDQNVRDIAAGYLREQRGREAGNVAAAIAAAAPVEDNSVFADVPVEARLRVAEQQMAEADFASPEFDPRNANARLEEDSARFDSELKQQIDGTLPKDHVYQMGRPGPILRSTGIPDLPIQLAASRLAEKSLDPYHPFEIADVTGLVKALQAPVAIFAYGDRTKAQNIIVEISSNGKNFLVGLSLNPEIGGRVLNVNSIRNVFPKDTAEWLNWIAQGKLLYADKQKVQDLIDQQRINLADVTYLDLNRVNSVLNSFVNPQAENLQPQSAALFATPEFDPDARRLGITKADLERQSRNLGRVPWRPKKRTWAEVYQRSEAALNQSGFIEELVADAARYARPLSAEHTIAVGQHLLVLGKQYEEIRALRQDVEHTIVEATRDNATTEDLNELGETLKQVKQEESKISKRYDVADKAMRMSKAQQGLALAANKAQFTEEFDFLGMKANRQAALGRDLTPEEIRQLHEICDRARDLDEDARAELWAAVHAQAERTIKDLFMKDSVKRSGDSRKKKLTDYRKKYLDAMAHLKVWRDTVGGSLIGITGDEYGTWNRPLFDMLLWHRFQNPDITAAEALQKVTEDVNTYITADETTVARILTGFERSWDINRHDDVLRGGRDLRSQILTDLQIGKLLNGEMPGKTGPIPGEPSAELREKRHTRDVLKSEREDETNDPRKLQGRQKRWLKWYDNRIEDLKREIAAGERLPQTKRTLAWTEEMKQKRAEYEELVRERDRVCGKSGLSEEERAKRYEATLERTLRRKIENLYAARSGDFRFLDHPEKPTGERIKDLQNEISNINYEINAVKRERFLFGRFRTGADIDKFNENKIRTREKRAAYWQALTAPNADRSVVKKPQIPMSPEQQARYEEAGQQLKKLRRQAMDMRAHDELMKKPWLWRHGVEYTRFINGLTRGFLATADHSAVLRQMAQLSLGHPKLAAQVFKNTIGTAFSDEKATRINAELLSDPRIKEAVDKGWLNWRNIEAEGNSGDVEMFSSLHSSQISIGKRRFSLDDLDVPKKLSDYITKPASELAKGLGFDKAARTIENGRIGVGAILRGSERIYATYINALSAEIYLALTNADGFTARLMFGQNGLTDYTKKEIAARINMANGSMQVDKADNKQFLRKMTMVFWAPKLALSRLQLAIGWDVIHPLLDNSADIKTRIRTAGFNAIEHARAKLAMIALGTLMLMLAGDDDDKEKLRRASMFQKFLQVVKPRIGSTTLDYSGGEVGWYQLMAKLATLEKETSTGKKVYLADKDGHKKTFGTGGWSGEIARFAEGKLNPIWANIGAVWSGEDYVGQPFGLGDLAINTFVPLGATDIAKAFAENGLGRGLLLAPQIFFGAGGNTYPLKRYEIAANQFTEVAKSYDAVRDSRDLSDDERSDMMEEIEGNFPELKQRGRIEGAIGKVKFFQSEIKKVQKAGAPVPPALTDGLEQAKLEALDYIREARKPVDSSR